MKKSLITYSTVDGQTKDICQKIAYFANNENIDVLPINKIENLNQYDFIVIGASIRYGKYRKELFNFIKRS